MLIRISVRCNYILTGVVGIKESGDTTAGEDKEQSVPSTLPVGVYVA